jgi:hypothetical protein
MRGLDAYSRQRIDVVRAALLDRANIVQAACISERIVPRDQLLPPQEGHCWACDSALCMREAEDLLRQASDAVDPVDGIVEGRPRA